MDIFRFIPSRDIRGHLKQIGYSFTAPEAAFLVWQCYDATLKEKFAAWQEIIAAMPDASMDRRLNMDRIGSLHDFMKSYMDLTKRLLDDFYLEDGAVYFYQWIERQGDEYEEVHFEAAFPSLSACLADLMQQAGRCLHRSSEEKQASEERLLRFVQRLRERFPECAICMTEAADIPEVAIRRQDLSAPGRTVTLFLNNKLEALDVEASTSCLTEEEQDLLLTFEGMWFAFPTPFQRGDIVYRCGSCKRWHCAPVRFQHGSETAGLDCQAGDFGVLDALPTWNTEDMIQNGFSAAGSHAISGDRLLQNLKKNGDITDMSFSAYFIDGGEIVKDNRDWYLSLERYDGPLPGGQRLLYAVSRLLTGRIELDDFLAVLQVAQADRNRKRIGEIRESLGYIKETADCIDPVENK